MEAQSLSVKRAQVEFHQFASLGEPDVALRAYLDENIRRGSILRNHLGFAGALSPFLEIGANAGHSSYMLANEFGAQGFALDISADALRHGRALMDLWKLERAPVRVAGDAVHLPFAGESLRFVCAFQMLSQFMDIEQVFLEVKRVLMPGGVFFFAEEPIRRTLSLRLMRVPYERQMKPWERRLHQWGLLGYLAKDVIGARQEESFGIRQNHAMTLRDWHNLIAKHFVACEYELFVPRRGWAESSVAALAHSLDRLHSEWLPARLLGGTLAAFCRKAGEPPADSPPLRHPAYLRPGVEREAEGPPADSPAPLHPAHSPPGVECKSGEPPADSPPLAGCLERFLRCPDCAAPLRRDRVETLECAACGYRAPDEGGVYNLLPSADKKQLYPGARPDILDFGQPEHASALGEGFYELEGVYGNKFRWIGARAVCRLRRVDTGPAQLRLRGHASEHFLRQGQPARIEILANGGSVGQWTLDRPGLFVLETPLFDAGEYEIEILASPTYKVPPDERTFSVNVSLIRLAPREDA